MTQEDALAYVGQAPWKFASTMPHIPHWYTVRGHTPDDQFEGFVRYLRRNGRCRLFGSRHGIYLDLGAYRYWTMGAPVENTIIINRQSIDVAKGINRPCTDPDPDHVSRS